MKKKLISLLLAALMVLSVLPLLVGADDAPKKLKISIESGEVARTEGSTVSLDVKLDENPGIVSATIPVVWNPEYLILTGVDYDDKDFVITQGWCGVDIGSDGISSGKYYLAWNNDTMCDYDENKNPIEKKFEGTGTLCTLTFKLVKSIGENEEIPVVTVMPGDGIDKLFTIMSWDMVDYMREGNVNREFEDGELTAVDKVAVPGDADGSGAFDLDDVFYVLYHYFFEDLYPLNGFDADFDKSGEFDLDDVFYILYHYFFSDLYPLN